LALASFGKWALRRLAFPKILHEVALSSSKAARTQKLAKESLRDAAAIKLQTTYASFWRRLGAYVLDLGLFMLGLVLFFVAWALAIDLLIKQGFSDYIIGGFLFPPFIVDWLYEVMMVRSLAQSTLGMRALSIFVTDRSGERLSFGRATAWHFARFLSYLTLGIGFLFPPSARRRQPLHDVISRSVVLVKPGKKVPAWLTVICLILGLFEAIPLGYFLLLAGMILIGWISSLY